MAQPLADRYNNLMHIFNDHVSLLIVYLIMVINGVITDVPTIVIVGDWIAYSLYFTWGVNAFYTVTNLLFTIYKKVRRVVRSKY